MLNVIHAVCVDLKFGGELVSCLSLQWKPLCVHADLEYKLGKRWLTVVASVSLPEARGICTV